MHRIPNHLYRGLPRTIKKRSVIASPTNSINLATSKNKSTCEARVFVMFWVYFTFLKILIRSNILNRFIFPIINLARLIWLDLYNLLPHSQHPRIAQKPTCLQCLEPNENNCALWPQSGQPQWKKLRSVWASNDEETATCLSLGF